MKTRYATALPLLLLSATAARAEDDWCRNGLFPSEPPFALARVTGKGRAFFHDDMDGCPGKGAACRARSYVIPGDVVVTNRTSGAYTCAFFAAQGEYGSAGWVETRRLRRVEFDPAPPESAWLGVWASGDNPVLRFTRQDSGLHVTGEAFWPGRQVPPDSPYQSIHTGEVDGPVTIAANRGEYGDENLCEVRFTLLGNLLLAGDNGDCGGANVSFSGVYRRGK